MSELRILADENIPLVGELFGRLDEVVTAPGRSIDADYPGLATFDVLAIRSVTKITEELVERAERVRVIATATIGTDHIDLAGVERAAAGRPEPVRVISAPGSNAESVADYIFYALMRLTEGAGRPLSATSLGIVGHGNCGSRVARRAAGFGMRLLRCDPPLAERDPGFASDALEDALGADFVTLHVPLTRRGEDPWPTERMIGASELALMHPGAFLLNASRGGVVDSAAVAAALREGEMGGAVVDVFEGEPEPPAELIGLPVIATPHIAGYAVEAKRRGAAVIYEETCRILGREAAATRPMLLRGFTPPAGEEVAFAAGGDVAAAADEALRRLLAAIHDIDATSRELKATLGRPDRGAAFDAMRKNYERDCGRRELASYAVGFAETVAPALRGAVEARLAGFDIAVTAQAPHYVLAGV